MRQRPDLTLLTCFMYELMTCSFLHVFYSAYFLFLYKILRLCARILHASSECEWLKSGVEIIGTKIHHQRWTLFIIRARETATYRVCIIFICNIREKLFCDNCFFLLSYLQFKACLISNIYDILVQWNFTNYMN